MKGWKQRLQTVYESFEEFKAYDEIYNNAARLGYPSALEAWKANPVVDGGVRPEDYRKVRD